MMTASPSDSNYNTNRLSEMLVEIEGFTQPSGKKWLVNYHKLEDFPFSKIDDLSEEEIESVFNKILDTFSLIVEKVENKFLEYRNELSKMKNI